MITVYAQTWHQIVKKSWFFRERLILQHVATCLYSPTKGMLCFRNADVSLLSVKDESRRLFLQDKQGVACWRSARVIGEVLNEFISNMYAHAKIEFVIFDESGADQIIISDMIAYPYPMHYFQAYSGFMVRNLYIDLVVLAASIPDSVFSDMESPFAYSIPLEEDQVYTIEEKLSMLKTHPDYPDANNSNSIITQAMMLNHVDGFIKNFKYYNIINNG